MRTKNGSGAWREGKKDMNVRLSSDAVGRMYARRREGRREESARARKKGYIQGDH